METTASGPSLIDSENKDLSNIYSRARVVSEQCDVIVSLEHERRIYEETFILEMYKYSFLWIFKCLIDIVEHQSHPHTIYLCSIIVIYSSYN